MRVVNQGVPTPFHDIDVGTVLRPNVLEFAKTGALLPYRAARLIGELAPQWRSVSSALEYRRYWRSRLIKLIGRRDIFPSISNNYKIVASHRESYIYQKP